MDLLPRIDATTQEPTTSVPRRDPRIAQGITVLATALSEAPHHRAPSLETSDFDYRADATATLIGILLPAAPADHILNLLGEYLHPDTPIAETTLLHPTSHQPSLSYHEAELALIICGVSPTPDRIDTLLREHAAFFDPLRHALPPVVHDAVIADFVAHVMSLSSDLHNSFDLPVDPTE